MCLGRAATFTFRANPRTVNVPTNTPNPMVATFCLRLALGMLGALALLSPKQMHPRFFRTHFLTVLGLCLVATVMAWGTNVGLAALAAAGLAFLGAVVWIFERAPAGWTF